MRSLNIVFQAPGDVALLEGDVDPLGPGEILCRAERSLISTGTETLSLLGLADPGTNWSEFLRFPFSPGYSMVARVIEAGEGVDGVRVGDRVTARVAHCQLFKTSAARATPVPDAISDEDATWASLAQVAQLGARRADLKLGERVGIVGMGILGQLVAQYMLLSGAREVVAIDIAEHRLSLAEAHGATYALPLDVDAAYKPVREITGGAMLDLVFDITGNPNVLAPACRLVRPLGRLILLGDTTTPSRQHLGARVVADSIAILGIHGTMFPAQPSAFNPWTLHEMTALFFDYLMQGRMRVADLVTHRVSPREAPEIYAGLLRDRSSAMGVIFDWTRL